MVRVKAAHSYLTEYRSMLMMKAPSFAMKSCAAGAEVKPAIEASASSKDRQRKTPAKDHSSVIASAA